MCVVRITSEKSRFSYTAVGQTKLVWSAILQLLQMLLLLSDALQAP
jgi:hypothetical protein